MAVRELIDGAVAMVFPGQGAQFVGMGEELTNASAAARRVFAEADQTLGFALTKLIFRGPADELEDTINAQPAILATSIAALEALRERLAERGAAITPAMVAGHSLGEFSALVAAGALDFRVALRLVRERGQLMKEAGEESPGGMAAILGLDDDVLAGVCAEASPEGIVVLANANCPGQTVISGQVAALERAMALAKERGAKRTTRLGVSIASHSPLMARAAARFAGFVAATPLRDPRVPVVGNVTAAPLTSVADIRDELSRQIASPVNWTGSVRAMIEAGVTTFLDLGPGQVVNGLIKRIDREVATLGTGDLGIELPTVASR
jgi:[acyl-carrier-protein] S-malonyltransferase